MARTLELDTITEPSNSGTANITLSSNTTTTMPLVDINGGAIDGTTVGAGTPSSVAATTLTASGATTLNGDVTLGNASADTITVTGTMAGVDNKSGMTGEVRMWAGSSAPTGWLFCNGAAVSRSTYSALFAITSTSFGIGDGSSTFNVPDMKGRMPVGVGTGTGGGAEDADGSTVPSGGSALEARSLGEWTGAEVISTAHLTAHTHTSPAHDHTSVAHTHGMQSHTHTMSSHTHSIDVSGGSHNHNNGSYQYLLAVNGSATVQYVDNSGGTEPNLTSSGAIQSTSHSHSGTSGINNGATAAPNNNTTTSTTPGNVGSTTPGATGSTGSGSKFTPPIMCVNFIIKT